MDESAQTLPNLELPNRIHRELRKGETIYHSTLPCHVSNRFPNGKWIAQTRREEKGRLIKYPVKGFGTPSEALDYLKSLRPDERGKVHASAQGEPTVRDLYEFVKSHRQKRIGTKTKESKVSRWDLYIAPEWADCPLSKVTSRAAQEWISGLEVEIAEGRAGSLGLPQLDKIRTDLSSLFGALPSFSQVYEDRRNPFVGLEFTPAPPRAKTTIESRYFAALFHICPKMAEEGFCTTWAAEMFMTSLLSGLRYGEVMGLCKDQIDFKNGAIVVDRAMRRSSRAIDPVTRIEFGPVLRASMHYPKGGSYANPRTRAVPLSGHLADMLKTASNRENIV